jgi:hypothetical protein
LKLSFKRGTGRSATSAVYCRKFRTRPRAKPKDHYTCGAFGIRPPSVGGSFDQRCYAPTPTLIAVHSCTQLNKSSKVKTILRWNLSFRVGLAQYNSHTWRNATRTRRRREQYIPSVAFCLCHFLADFIICMCEFDFRQAQVEIRHFWHGLPLISSTLECEASMARASLTRSH